jgi:hypothetical protein
MTPKQEYERLLTSGMFWEFYPDLTGDWNKDKRKFRKIFKNLSKTRIRTSNRLFETF